MITQLRLCLPPAVDSRTVGLVICMPLTANQVNLLNCFLFQQLQLPWSPIRCTDERTRPQLHLLSLIMPAPAVSEGDAVLCSHDMQSHRHAGRPTGQASRRLTVKCQRDRVKLNSITGFHKPFTSFVKKTVLTCLIHTATGKASCVYSISLLINVISARLLTLTLTPWPIPNHNTNSLSCPNPNHNPRFPRVIGHEAWNRLHSVV